MKKISEITILNKVKRQAKYFNKPLLGNMYPIFFNNEQFYCISNTYLILMSKETFGFDILSEYLLYNNTYNNIVKLLNRKLHSFYIDYEKLDTFIKENKLTLKKFLKTGYNQLCYIEIFGSKIFLNPLYLKDCLNFCQTNKIYLKLNYLSKTKKVSETNFITIIVQSENKDKFSFLLPVYNRNGLSGLEKTSINVLMKGGI